MILTTFNFLGGTVVGIAVLIGIMFLCVTYGNQELAEFGRFSLTTISDWFHYIGNMISTVSNGEINEHTTGNPLSGGV